MPGSKTISIGTNSFVTGDGAFSAQAVSVPPPCNDNNACTVDACVGGGTAVGFCRNTATPSGTSCSDGNTCNGAEVCDGAGQCQPGTIAPPGTSCPDSDLCNGDETCDGAGSCLAGPPPVVDDNNVCTADACDATAGVIHTPLPDGTTCNATGVCAAGTCTVTFPSSGSFSYSGFDTDSANRNTFNFDIPMVAGQTLSAGTCGLPGASGSGDTFLRLFDS